MAVPCIPADRAMFRVLPETVQTPGAVGFQYAQPSGILAAFKHMFVLFFHWKIMMLRPV